MRLTNCKRLVRLASLLCAISASSCATDRERIAAAEAEKANVSIIDEAISIGATSEPIPPAPPQCSGPVRAGVSPDDRADVALVRQDAALTRANSTLAACAAFYEGVRNGRLAR